MCATFPSQTFVLASQPARDASELFSDVLPWLIVLIALVVVGGAIIYWVKRTIGASDEAAAEPFTLHGLRQLRASGQITDEEFERARAAMIGRLKSKADEPAEAAGENGLDDNDAKQSGNDADEEKSH